jgi:2-oxoglutarate ferredoxin oxidoreductase subunit alpha
MLHLTELWPFPAKNVQTILNDARICYVIENNAGGQLARLIRSEIGIAVTGTILKYDGRPFTPAYIVEKVGKGEVSTWLH